VPFRYIHANDNGPQRQHVAKSNRKPGRTFVFSKRFFEYPGKKYSKYSKNSLKSQERY